MSSDLLALSALATELNQVLTGARIDKIVQPENDEIRFFVRNNGKNLCLVASCNSGAPRLHITNDKKPNPITAPSFCMLLRKHLQISGIESVSIFNDDRIIDIKFVARTEMKDETSFHLFAELMNRYSNLVFTDENLKILDSMKHLALDELNDHIVLRGVTYKAVEQPKISYLNASKELFADYFGGDLHKFILDRFSGLAGVSVAELINRAGLSDNTEKFDDNKLEKLLSVFEEYKNIDKQPYYSPHIINDKEVYPFDYQVLSGEKHCFSSMSDAYEKLYGEADGKIRQKARLKTLNTATKRLIDKVNKNIAQDNDRLKECEEMEKFRIFGELIVNNIYLIKKGDEVLECFDYYAEKNVKIALDKQLSPSGNSKKYYTKYNKLKRQKEFTEKKLVDDTMLLNYALSIKEELDTLPLGASTTGIEEELNSVGAYKKQSSKTKVRKEKPEPPYEYFYNGFTILKGKNNLQNDELTFRIASSSDVWLHLKNAHGSHVIVLTEGKQVPDDVIKVAAEIANGKDASAEVDYTERRNVKRQPNGHPGQVIYVNYKTILVEPNAHKELLEN